MEKAEESAEWLYARQHTGLSRRIETSKAAGTHTDTSTHTRTVGPLHKYIYIYYKVADSGVNEPADHTSLLLQDPPYISSGGVGL